MTVDLAALVNVAGPVRDRVSRSGGSMRLGSVLPVLAWEPGRGWAEAAGHLGVRRVGHDADAQTSWSTLASPDGVEVLATGVEVSPGPLGSHGRARLRALRRPLLAGPRSPSSLPDPVVVTVAVHDSVGESAEGYLSRIADDLQLAARAFGAYPWPSFSMAVTPDLRGRRSSSPPM